MEPLPHQLRLLLLRAWVLFRHLVAQPLLWEPTAQPLRVVTLLLTFVHWVIAWT